MGLLSCHDSKLKIKFWKVETKCSKAQNLTKKSFARSKNKICKLAKCKKIKISLQTLCCFWDFLLQNCNIFLRCCAKNFSEFQICQCSPTVLVCFPGLKPCKWWSENWSANVWKKVLKLWKQSFAGLQSGKKKKNLCKHNFVFEFSFFRSATLFFTVLCNHFFRVSNLSLFSQCIVCFPDLKPCK